MEPTETSLSSLGFIATIIQHPYFVIGALLAIILVAVFIRLSHSHNESEYKYKPEKE